MWTSLIENAESVKAIYGNEVPSLQDISFHEINFISGVNLISNLRFDLKELPAIPPLKWIEKSVNVVQIHLQMISVEVMSFEYHGSRLLGNIEIISDEDRKRVELTVFNRKVFVLKTKWIYVSAITGYTKDSTSR